MDAARTVRSVRLAAGLTQRQLATRAGVPQSTVGRIESGALDPRYSTVVRILRACGMEPTTVARPGAGVDRSQLRERLRLTPRARLDQAVAAAAGVNRLRKAAR